MANYNYGIDCQTGEVAQLLHDQIAETDIYQDGLDVSDERVSVISKTALLDILKGFAAEEKTALSVEVWPDDVEYDEAEAGGSLELHSFGN